MPSPEKPTPYSEKTGARQHNPEEEERNAVKVESCDENTVVVYAQGRGIEYSARNGELVRLLRTPDIGVLKLEEADRKALEAISSVRKEKGLRIPEKVVTYN